MSDASARSRARAAENNKFVSAAFDIMKLALTADMTAIDAILARTYLESGTRGLLVVTRALAMTAMIVRPDLRAIMPRLGPALLAAQDPRPIIDDMFTFQDQSGQPYPFAETDIPTLVCGLLFLHACATDGILAVERFNQAAAQGKQGVGELVGGVLMVLTAVLRAMPEDRLNSLLKFQTGSPAGSKDMTPPTATATPEPADSGAETVPETGLAPEPAPEPASAVVPPFDLPDALKAKLLAAACLPDRKQAARRANMLVAPLLLLHGETGLIAVCRALADAIATDVFGLSPDQIGDGRRIVVPMFTDETNAPLDVDDAALSDPMVYAQVLGYQFLAAYLNQDTYTELDLMRRDDDQGSMLCNGLAAIYRIHLLAPVTQDTKED